ncbi:MAG: rhombosortase [Planctomycetota bacterium]
MKIRAFAPITLFLAGFAIACTIVVGLHELSQDRETAFATGQWWRPLTGHFAHASLAHVLMDLPLWLVAGVWRERRVGAKRYALELLFLMLMVACGVRILHADWRSYEGLSGVIHGLVALFLTSLAADRDRARWLRAAAVGVLLLLTTRALLELGVGGWLYQDAELTQRLGVRLYAGSHVAGIVGGALIGIAALTLGLLRSAPKIGS